jgi:Sec-independent protein translocase protein TatA
MSSRKVATEVTKRVGRKRKARGAKAATPAQRAGAKQAGMSLREFKKLSDDKQKRFIKEAKEAETPKKKKQPRVKRTPAENKELAKLRREQQREMREGSSDILPSRRATGPKGQEVQQGPLLSKVPTPTKNEMSPAARRRLGKSGMLKRGEYAPPREMVEEAMGARRGSEMMPTGKELDDLIASGFEIKKYGGKVKRRMGGKVRGYGKALRGY